MNIPHHVQLHTCPVCKGSKVLGIGDFDDNDKVITMSECPYCGGRGKVTEAELDALIDKMPSIRKFER
jgi:DnaJ-class molecular chaperone